MQLLVPTGVEKVFAQFPKPGFNFDGFCVPDITHNGPKK
jgi:hypothetical protein